MNLLAVCIDRHGRAHRELPIASLSQRNNSLFRCGRNLVLTSVADRFTYLPLRRGGNSDHREYHFKAARPARDFTTRLAAAARLGGLSCAHRRHLRGSMALPCRDQFVFTGTCRVHFVSFRDTTGGRSRRRKPFFRHPHTLISPLPGSHAGYCPRTQVEQRCDAALQGPKTRMGATLRRLPVCAPGFLLRR
jgi:hypothetical protein